MPGYTGKTNNQAREVVGRQAQAERNDIWGEIPGKIVSFDAAKQTATIQPLYKPKFNGQPVDMPELQEIPVRFPRAGFGAVTFPVQVGNLVSLRPQMRSSENYHTDGDGAASDSRSFNLSDYEAFMDGGESLTDPIPNFDGENMHIRADPDGNFGLRMSQDGKVKLEGAEGNIYEILTEIAELLGNLTTTVGSGSSAGIWDITQQPELTALAQKLRAMVL